VSRIRKALIANEENKKNRSEAQSASLTKITKIESLLSKLEALLQNDSLMESISTEADLDKLYQNEQEKIEPDTETSSHPNCYKVFCVNLM